jgi:putative lipoic acid-binding regulatory protein
MQKKQILYPARLSLKAVFRAGLDCDPHLIILEIINDSAYECEVSTLSSRNGKFISYTITAIFKSEESLDNSCAKISEINGFMMMI